MAIVYTRAQSDGSYLNGSPCSTVAQIPAHPVHQHTNAVFLSGDQELERDQVIFTNGDFVVATGPDIEPLRARLGSYPN